MDVDYRRSSEERRGIQHCQVLGAWPLLLTSEQACAYLGVSLGTFRKVCPVPAVALGAAVTRWNRNHIDEWVNSLPPKAVGKTEPKADVARPYDAAREASEARRQASINKIRERTRDRLQR